MHFLYKRREFIRLLGGAATWPLGARAQQRERVRRVGVFTNLASDDPEAQARGIHAGPACAVRLSWQTTNYTRYRQYAASWWLSVRVSFYALLAQLDVVVLIRPIQAIATRTPDER
jgi:hypothetical protein